MQNNQDQSNQFRVRKKDKTSTKGDSPLKDKPNVNSRYGSNIESNEEQSDYIF